MFCHLATRFFFHFGRVVSQLTVNGENSVTRDGYDTDFNFVNVKYSHQRFHTSRQQIYSSEKNVKYNFFTR